MDEEIFAPLKLTFHRGDVVQSIVMSYAGEVARLLHEGNNFSKLLFTVLRDSLSLFALYFPDAALN